MCRAVESSSLKVSGGILLKKFFMPMFAVAAASLYFSGPASACNWPFPRVQLGESRSFHASMRAGSTCARFRGLAPGTAESVVWIKPKHGSLTLTDAYVSYTPLQGFHGQDIFSIGLRTGGGTLHRKIIMQVR